MTLPGDVLEKAGAVAFGDTDAALSAILRPDCAAALWSRGLEPEVRTWIESLPPAHLPKARVILRPEAVRDEVTGICDACGTPGGAERAWLVDDIARLADRFSGLMRTPSLLLRLDVITTNACRKFHIDAVTARLICTYRGTGTQFGIATDGADPQRIDTVPTGAPVVLRGTLWPERPVSGLRHRSPPIEGTGETRLMLVLDPVANPEEHPDRTLLH